MSDSDTESDRNSDTEDDGYNYGMPEKDPNYVEEPEERQPPFDYERYPWMDKNTLPDFILPVLDAFNFFDEQKHIIVEEFLYKYMHDSKYRKYVQGGFLVLMDRIYLGIFYSFSEIMNLGTWENSKIAIPIFEKHENNNSYITTVKVETSNGIETITEDHTPIHIGSKKVSINEKHSKVTIEVEDINNQGLKIVRDQKYKLHHLYKARCGISHLSSTDKKDRKYILYPPMIEIDGETEMKLPVIDTGCEKTNLFVPFMWDFTKVHINRAFGKISKEWARKIGAIRQETFGLPCNQTGKGYTVYLLSPLYVSFDGLESVPIYMFTVPFED